MMGSGATVYIEDIETPQDGNGTVQAGTPEGAGNNNIGQRNNHQLLLS